MRVKRIFMLIVAVIFSAVPLFTMAGCNSDKGYSQAGRLVIKIGDAAKDAFDELARRYTAETGVPVLVQVYTGLSDSGNLALYGPLGKAQDIYLQGVGGDLGTSASAGHFMQIDKSKLNTDALIDSAKDIFDYKGSTYGIALGMETYGIIYNKDLISEIPETWDEFETKISAINNFGSAPKNHKYGFLIDTSNPYFTNAFVEAFGGYIFYKNEDGTWDPSKMGIDTPETIRAYEFLKGLYDRGLLFNTLQYDFNTMTAKFKGKQVAAILDGPWSVPVYKSFGIDVGVAKIPAIKIDGVYKDPISFSGAYGLAISNYSLNKELSIDFLNFAVREDNVMLYYRATGRMPSISSCYELDEIKNDKTITGLLDQIDYSQPQPNINEMEAIWAPLMAAANDVFVNNKSIPDTLKKCQTSIKEALTLLTGGGN